MRNKGNKITYPIIFFFFSILFLSCKKYPENTLWFKKPENIIQGDYKITQYTINGNNYIDGLSTQLGLDVTTLEWHFYENHGSGDIYGLNNDVVGLYKFAEKKKKLSLTFYSAYFDPPNQVLQTIFAVSSGNWDIVKLINKGKPVLKIKRVINGNAYEIQFN